MTGLLRFPVSHKPDPPIFAAIFMDAMRIPPKLCSLLIALCLCAPAFAQRGTSVAFEPSKGIIVKQDSTFEMVFRFRMQDRAHFTLNTGDAAEDASTFFLVRFRPEPFA